MSPLNLSKVVPYPLKSEGTMMNLLRDSYPIETDVQEVNKKWALDEVIEEHIQYN